MHSDHSRFVRALMTAVFAAAFTAAPGFAATKAPQHVVTPNQLQQSAIQASQARRQNIDELRQILSTPQAQEAFNRAHANPKQVKKAIAGLSDQQLAQLTNRARTAQRDFAAGEISSQAWIIILLSTILIIVLIIAA